MPTRCLAWAVMLCMAACSTATPPPPAERIAPDPGMSAPPTPAAPIPAPGADPAFPPGLPPDCTPEAASGLLGESPDADVVRRAAQLAGARSTRVVAHGQPVTADYSHERLNVLLGPNGRIRAFTCG